MNLRPQDNESCELPNCSTLRYFTKEKVPHMRNNKKENLKYLVYCLFFTSFRDFIVIITYNIKLVNIEIKSAYKCTLHFYKQHLIQINTHNQLKNL